MPFLLGIKKEMIRPSREEEEEKNLSFLGRVEAGRRFKSRFTDAKRYTVQ